MASGFALNREICLTSVAQLAWEPAFYPALPQCSNHAQANVTPPLPHANRQEMSEATFTITELSREFDVTPRTIRYYEDQGLLFPQRSGLQRVYAKRDRTRLKLALRGKRLGLSLAEIKGMIDMYDTAQDEEGQLVKFLAALAQRRAALEQQREDIEALLAEINGFELQCRELLAAEAPRVTRAKSKRSRRAA